MELCAEGIHNILLCSWHFVFIPGPSKLWQLGFLISLYLLGSEFAPTVHAPVIFSPIQFLCILLLEERCVQVQALQLFSEGSQVPGLCQQHSSRVPIKTYSTSLQPNHPLSILRSVLFPSLNRVRSQNRAYRTPTSALTIIPEACWKNIARTPHPHKKQSARNVINLCISYQPRRHYLHGYRPSSWLENPCSILLHISL